MIRYSEPYLLSDKGSDRATAYIHSNKIVTIAGRTHVVWTDAPAVTRGRTCDHDQKTWSSVYTIGEGCDNHNDPSLTADRKGRLRLVYGPHGDWDHVHRMSDWPSGKFKFVAATEPDNLACLDANAVPTPVHHSFGYSATYNCLVHTADDRDAIVYRGGESPWSAMFQKSRPEGGWTNAIPLFRQAIAPQYTHYGAQLVGASNGTLFAAAHFYAKDVGAAAGIAVLASCDGGLKWSDLRGRRVAVPTVLTRRIAVPHPPPADDPRLGGLALAPDNRLWALTHARKAGACDTLLSRWDGQTWMTHNLAPFLPEGRGCSDAALAIDTAGRIHVLAAAVNLRECKRADDMFIHPSLRLFHLCSRDDGASFDCHAVGPDRPGRPTRHPSLSKTGPFHPVEKPVFLMTCGLNKTETEVYCMFIEEIDDRPSPELRG